MKNLVALFGEAEKGDFATPFSIQSVKQLHDTLGHPPHESQGIFLGIQVLLYENDLIYIRVKEEGFSTKDYLKGLNKLQDKSNLSNLIAICVPGVGDSHIIDSVIATCDSHHSLLMTTEKDLYDYLTSFHIPRLS